MDFWARQKFYFKALSLTREPGLARVGGCPPQGLRMV